MTEVTMCKKPRQNSSLKAVGGSLCNDFNTVNLNQILATIAVSDPSDETRNGHMNALLAAMQGIAPRDEVEGMLATQMVACHFAAMECYRRAAIPEQTIDGRRLNLGQANKLSRTFTDLLQALNRQRGMGQQKVTVEHVHVHDGGQAIVGSVEQGGGLHKNGEEQPHAQAIPHAPQPAMRSQDEEREPVPRTGDAKR